MKQNISPADIQIRNFLPLDIDKTVKYWTENAEYFAVRGVDTSKFKSAQEYRKEYELAFRENGDFPRFSVILYKGQTIGLHLINNVVEFESAVFHSHIWAESYRGIGVGVYSYIKAAEHFLNKFSLKNIIYKTPVINFAANRVKEKIGIPCLGKTVLNDPLLIKPLDANLYEMDRELLDSLKSIHLISQTNEKGRFDR